MPSSCSAHSPGRHLLDGDISSCPACRGEMRIENNPVIIDVPAAAPDNDAARRHLTFGYQVAPRTLMSLYRTTTSHREVAAICDSPNVPVSILTAEAASKDWRVRARVAAHPSTPESVWRELVHDGDGFVEVWCLASPHSPTTALERASQSSLDTVRIAVASNPTLPEVHLRRLLNDPCDDVATAGFLNVGMNDAMFLEMASHPSDGVRWLVAANTAIPGRLLEALMRDDNPSVAAKARGNAMTRVHHRLGVAPDNELALAGVRALGEWWALRPEDPRVERALADYPNGDDWALNLPHMDWGDLAVIGDWDISAIK